MEYLLISLVTALLNLQVTPGQSQADHPKKEDPKDWRERYQEIVNQQNAKREAVKKMAPVDRCIANGWGENSCREHYSQQ